MNCYPILPVPKPRMTQRDKWQQRPAVMRYRAFKDDIRLRKVELPTEGAMVEFAIPMPKSWSNARKSKMDGTAHRQKPDIDNLVKALADACFEDDSLIHTIAARKVWAQRGEIRIRPWNWGDPWPGETD
jgi:Holliday junction resolvase RusA-like endonuclease